MNRLRSVLLGAILVATVGALVSLALSEIMGLAPCELCWYQRLLLYPQILVIGAAASRLDVRYVFVALVMSLGGIVVAAYHSWLQLQSASTETCSLSNPCSTVAFEVAGLSIPNLSFLTFLALSVLLLGGLVVSYRQ
ncbi:MAG: disulfide bond formation protein B [Halodesulfurarchaeum sp.]